MARSLLARALASNRTNTKEVLATICHAPATYSLLIISCFEEVDLLTPPRPFDLCSSYRCGRLNAWNGLERGPVRCERRLMLHSSFQVNSHSLGHAEQCDSYDETHVAAIQTLGAGAELHKRRRRAVRYPCSGAIRVAWTSNFDRYVMGQCVDISRTGLRMLISDPIPTRTSVCFKVDCLAFGGSGTVRHCKKQKEKYMIGVDFAGGLQWLATGQHITALHEGRTVTGNSGISGIGE